MIDAREYLNPANISGGMSSSPILIITKEDDHNTVTNRASKTAKILSRLLNRDVSTSVPCKCSILLSHRQIEVGIIVLPS